jgi:hypothetical protein
MNAKTGLALGAVFAFFVMGFVAMKQAMPEAKEARIYKAIEIYSPYKLEKRMGGLTILNIKTGTKEKPASADVLHRYDELNKMWGKKHLKVENNDVIIMGEHNQSIVKIFIETTKERKFLKRFYGI